MIIKVNGEIIDILDRNSINLRINNHLYDPVEINNTTAEYSFSFNLPQTPKNNRIFDYANILAKPNKFNKIFSCEVYSDELLIFTGQLRISAIKDGFYQVNLVSIKVANIEDIFGDMKMNELDWEIIFNGANSINSYNANYASKVIFPLVSYGVFEKSPDKLGDYTSKFDLTDAKFYYETFLPSVNLVELVKRYFNQKGYQCVGNVFKDEILNNIYCSTNLAQEQIPVYNLGNYNLGSAVIKCDFSNYQNRNTNTARSSSPYTQNLNYKYLQLNRNDVWDWEMINVYDLWSDENSKITSEGQLFKDNIIVIPADGLYKIKLEATVNLPTGQTLTGKKWEVEYNGRYQSDPEQVNYTLENTLYKDMPVEIQVVRNASDVELIHGSKQWTSSGSEYYTAFPHEPLYSASNPTISIPNTGYVSSGYRRTTRSSRPSSSSNFRPSTRPNTSFRGYMPKNGRLLLYDPLVNPNFICGLSTIGDGQPSIIKNGYSWNTSDKNEARYNCPGYYSLEVPVRRGSSQPATETWTETAHNQMYLNSPANTNVLLANSYAGSVSGIVQLKKNDVISLKAITRYWEGARGLLYDFNANVKFEIYAYSPKPISSVDIGGRDWYSESQFSYNLQLGEFMNRETKISDFITNFVKEFNLECKIHDNIVELNTQAFDLNKPKYAVNLDNRVNKGESEPINYPKYLEIKYKTDTEEWGFDQSIPPQYVNEVNWKDYGEYGSDKIEIHSLGDETEDIQLTTSYTYYDDFTYMGSTISIPVISKTEYMIDGLDYEGAMKADGMSLPMRYWFRDYNSELAALVDGVATYFYKVSNSYQGVNLSYKKNENSLLTRYFNITPNLSSNYTNVKCYLNAYEYNQLKRGANVLFDSDVYIVSEIRGFDASGVNQTELKLIKK